MLRRLRPVEFDADRPVWKQVADDIRDQIRLGTLKPGEHLPGEARIAHEYEVGLSTVRTALRRLRSECLVITERAVGSRVREPEERSMMRVPKGARVTVRPATDAEQRRFGLAEHEPVMVIEVGGDEEVLPAYRLTLEVPDEPD
jgi:GntR family transcriptional regulator